MFSRALPQRGLELFYGGFGESGGFADANGSFGSGLEAFRS